VSPTTVNHRTTGLRLRGASKEWTDFSFPLWHLPIIIEKGVSIQARWSGYRTSKVTKYTKDSRMMAFHLLLLFVFFVARILNSYYSTPMKQDFSQPSGKTKSEDGKTPGSGQLDTTRYLE